MSGMDAPQKRRPGDVILDRYMPHASPEAREEARESLRDLAKVVLRMNLRVLRNQDEAIRANGDLAVESEHGS